MRRRMRWIQRLILAFLGRVWSTHPRPEALKRVVIVEMTRLGDVVAASSMIDAVAHAYPGASIQFVAAEPYAALFEGDSRLQFVGLPTTGFGFLKGAWSLRATLRGGDLGLFVASPAVRNSLLCLLSKPGLASGFLFPRPGGLGYDESQPIRFQEAGLRRDSSSGREDHLVDRAAKALSGLDQVYFSGPRLFSRATRETDLVVLHAGANWAWRRWPLENFQTLEGKLKEAGWRTCLIGPEEAMDLRSLRDLLASAALFIGNDSGPLHLAASLGTPCIGLFGPNLPARSGPWPAEKHVVLREEVPCCPCDQTICVQPHDWCMRKLSVQRVLEAVQAPSRSRDFRP